RRADVLDADDQLQVLQAQVDDLAGRLEEAKQQRYGLKQRQQQLNTEHGELVDAEDMVKDRIEAMERAGRITLTEEQERSLAAEFAAAVAPDDPDDLDRFQVNSQRLAERLREAVGDAEA